MDVAVLGAFRLRLMTWACLLCLCGLASSCSMVNGEDPAPIVEAVRREPALGLEPPGAVRIGQVDAFADSGSAVARQAYARCGAEEPAVRHYRSALEPLGWRRVERLDRWVGRVAGRKAELDVNFRGQRFGGCTLEIAVYYKTGLLGD